ncbi:MAG: DUF4062 domain-containing protein [Gammaproteobacteria bacterium]
MGSTEEQFQFIKKVIDDSDYYILIISGRFGSLSAEGIRYTEKEYDYAIEKGIPVLAFCHGKPKEIPAGKSELEPDARAKLNRFREKVSENGLVRIWTSASELAGLVASSLNKTIRTHAATGWVRGNTAMRGRIES